MPLNPIFNSFRWLDIVLSFLRGEEEKVLTVRNHVEEANKGNSELMYDTDVLSFSFFLKL